jgi:hypothetical protein
MLLQRCDTPPLLAATRCAIGLAEARGWSAATTAGVFYGLKAVLAGHAGDGPVPLSQVRQRVRPRSHSSAVRIAEVLAELGMLNDDTTAAIRAWIDRRPARCPPGSGATCGPGGGAAPAATPARAPAVTIWCANRQPTTL